MGESKVSLQRIAEWVIHAGVVTILFLPLYINSSYYFPFITPRNFAFRITVEIMLIAYGMLLVHDWRRYSFGRQPALIVLSLLFVWMSLTSWMNGDFIYSFWSNSERMEGLMHLIHIVGLLVVLVGVYKSRIEWQRLVRVSLMASYAVATIAVAQSLGVDFFIESSGGSRVTSTLGNATYVAAYSLFHIFFAAIILWQNQRATYESHLGKIWHRLLGHHEDGIERLRIELFMLAVLDIALLRFHFSSDMASPLLALFGNPILFAAVAIPQIIIVMQYFWTSLRPHLTNAFFLVLILLHAYTLFQTETRGPVIGFGLALIVLLVVISFLKRAPTYARRVSGAILLVFLLFSISIFIFSDAPFVKNSPTLGRISGISITSDTTTRNRFLTWQAAWQGIQEKPIQGWGEEKFYVVFNQFFPPGIFQDQGSRVWFDRAHNIYIQYLTNGGIIGLGLYLAFFIAVWMGLWKYARRTGQNAVPLLLGTALLAYALQNATVFDSLNSFIPLTLLIGYSLYVGRSDISSSERDVSFSQAGKIVLSGIMVITGVIGIYAFNIPQMQKNTDFIKGLREIRVAATVAELESAATHLENVIENGVYLGTFEMRQVYSESIADWVGSGQLPTELSESLAGRGIAMMERSIQEQPDNARHYAFFSNMLTQLGSVNQSYHARNIEVVLDGLERSPTRTPLYYSLGRSYEALGDPDKAREAYLHAIELSPDVPDGYIYEMNVALDQGQSVEEIIAQLEMLRAARPFTLQTSILYARVLRDADQAELSLEVVSQSLDNFGDQPALLVEEVLSYGAAGQIDRARALAQEIVQMDERFRPFVEEYVN